MTIESIALVLAAYAVILFGGIVVMRRQAHRYRREAELTKYHLEFVQSDQSVMSAAIQRREDHIVELYTFLHEALDLLDNSIVAHNRPKLDDLNARIDAAEWMLRNVARTGTLAPFPDDSFEAIIVDTAIQVSQAKGEWMRKVTEKLPPVTKENRYQNYKKAAWSLNMTAMSYDEWLAKQKTTTE